MKKPKRTRFRPSNEVLGGPIRITAKEGGSIYTIRALTERDREAILAEVVKFRALPKFETAGKFGEFASRIISKTLHDERGKPVSFQTVYNWPATKIHKLFEEIMSRLEKHESESQGLS
jgi:hypothetical protein